MMTSALTSAKPSGACRTAVSGCVKHQRLRRRPAASEGGYIATVSEPPDGLPRYRVLTGPDDDAFCHRVSEALRLGYELHGGPAVTFDGDSVIVAQALTWAAES